MTTPELHSALRSCANGIYPLEAGIELLISHCSWLERPDFRDRYISYDTSITDGTQLAVIDWQAAISTLDAGSMPCSGGEQRMLKLAASFAAGTPVSLQETLPGLDDRNIKLVVTAILHAHGQRPHRHEPSTQT